MKAVQYVSGLSEAISIKKSVMKHFTPDADISNVPSLTEFQVESCLRRIKKTSPGIDNIPASVFRTCSC